MHCIFLLTCWLIPCSPPQTSKSHFGYGAERRADGVTDGRASLGMQDSERSEDLIFARRGNAQGAQDFEGSAEDLVFARPGNARG
jgi:hypothetical protein